MHIKVSVVEKRNFIPSKFLRTLQQQTGRHTAHMFLGNTCVQMYVVLLDEHNIQLISKQYEGGT